MTDKDKKELNETELEKAAGGRLSVNSCCESFEAKNNLPLTRACYNCIHFEGGSPSEGTCDLGIDRSNRHDRQR